MKKTNQKSKTELLMTTAEKIAAAKKRVAELELLIKLWTKQIKT